MKDDTVVAEIEIAEPPERVFRALIDSKELMTWWGAEPAVDLKLMEMDARVGGRWRFEASDRVGRPVNGVTEFEAHGEVIEIDPPRRLAYTWIANWHDHREHATVVHWDLERTARGTTRVRVTHSGLENEPMARKDYTDGWVGVLRLLQNFLS